MKKLTISPASQAEADEMRGHHDSAFVPWVLAVGEVEGMLAEMQRPPSIEPVLIDVAEASKLLGIKPKALYERVRQHRVPGIVRTGTRLQFHKAKLLEGLERKARR